MYVSAYMEREREREREMGRSIDELKDLLGCLDPWAMNLDPAIYSGCFEASSFHTPPLLQGSE